MTTDTKDWDFAMKEVENSRALLTGTIESLAGATTPENWANAKDSFRARRQILAEAFPVETGLELENDSPGGIREL